MFITVAAIVAVTCGRLTVKAYFQLSDVLDKVDAIILPPDRRKRIAISQHDYMKLFNEVETR